MVGLLKHGLQLTHDCVYQFIITVYCFSKYFIAQTYHIYICIHDGILIFNPGKSKSHCIEEVELKKAGIPVLETSGNKKSYTLKGPDGASSLGILSGAYGYRARYSAVSLIRLQPQEFH